MKYFISFICWAVVVALATGGPTLIGLLCLVASDRPGEGTGVAYVLAMLGGLFVAAVGFVLGGLYGLVRARRISVLPVLGRALLGAVVVGVLTPGIYLLFNRWCGLELLSSTSERVVLRAVGGAAIGFVTGALYAIIRTRPNSSSVDPNRGAGR